jgi:exodeoxyribonuclease VII small subunit
MKKTKNWNYEATVAEIEAIVNRIESGELELAQVFDEFAVATKYLQQCQDFLQQHQQQMELLIEALVHEPQSSRSIDSSNIVEF